MKERNLQRPAMISVSETDNPQMMLVFGLSYKSNSRLLLLSVRPVWLPFRLQNVTPL